MKNNTSQQYGTYLVMAVLFHNYMNNKGKEHLVFMVHGIRQRLEEANLVDDAGTFRSTAVMLAEKHLTKYQRHSQLITCQVPSLRGDISSWEVKQLSKLGPWKEINLGITKDDAEDERAVCVWEQVMILYEHYVNQSYPVTL
ncbi:hypothetical protein SELMODRAFT_419733 [Selaginella moellendorffii]|uniref:Uncharacterized protein n=1 Tax=Selaginella moellendorffii TaxID=88036 RepID=D8S9V7_SELML|nr:hypothetical protein SELMODRAFT_419733 [Selaginella moellendorffii]